MDFLTTAVIVSWIAILLLSFALAGVIRQLHQLTASRREMPMRLIGPGDVVAELRDHAIGGAARTVFVFVDADCESCAEVLAHLSEVPNRDSVCVVSRKGAPPELPEDVHSIEYATDLIEKIAIPAFPYAVVADPTGTVSAALPVGAPELLRDLVEVDATSERFERAAT